MCTIGKGPRGKRVISSSEPVKGATADPDDIDEGCAVVCNTKLNTSSSVKKPANFRSLRILLVFAGIF